MRNAHAKLRQGTVFLLAMLLVALVATACGVGGTPESTPEPTPTNTPQPLIDGDPKSFALTLDDLPPGFYLEGEEPESDSYEVVFMNTEAVEGGIAHVIQRIRILESVDAAQNDFASPEWAPPDAKRVSGPELGDESLCFSFTVDLPEPAHIQTNEGDFDVDYLGCHFVSFRVRNVVVIVGTDWLGSGSVDTVVELATTAEEKLRGIAAEVK